MKKVYTALLFFIFSAFSFADNWIYELGDCWDSALSNPQASFEKYNKIADAMEKGNPGLDEYSNPEDIQEAWRTILEKFELYWTEHCPRNFTFSRLRKYITKKNVRVPFVVESENPENPELVEKKTVYKDEEVDVANYIVSVDSDFSLKYLEMLRIVQTGFRRARKPDWKMPRNWPVDSVFMNENYDYGNVAILSYSGNSPASLVRVKEMTFFDLDFDLKDKSGRTFLKSGRKLVGSGDVLFEDVDENIAKQIDSAIENNSIQYSPTELRLIYGSPDRISNYDRDWLENLPSKNVSLNEVLFRNGYEKYKREHNVINEAEAFILASELMVSVLGDGNLSSFEISKTEITQKLYKDVMNENPSGFKGSNKPVENVNWYDALMFCNRLSEICKKTPVYKVNDFTDTDEWDYEPHYGRHILGKLTIDESANGFRLPTEEEWMFAAHCGANKEETIYSGSDNLDVVAWYKKNAFKTHDVATKEKNSLEIFDMTGNVWEWCFDDADEIGVTRLAHGGSWNYDHRYCKIDDIYIRNPHQHFDCLGFRVVSGVSGSKAKKAIVN